ncbi:hypothetical protein NE237_024359 [Protea cynaroides]|uniref:Uncharacterized protein n=1 Tax=Protea cynaroides TaxID=273540 RepID=A0A9Q0HGS0_9MAGN|nr:hypothetical protein NE237_024359 [Protea cynaroides]
MWSSSSSMGSLISSRRARKKAKTRPAKVASASAQVDMRETLRKRSYHRGGSCSGGTGSTLTTVVRDIERAKGNGILGPPALEKCGDEVILLLSHELYAFVRTNSFHAIKEYKKSLTFKEYVADEAMPTFSIGVKAIQDWVLSKSPGFDFEGREALEEYEDDDHEGAAVLAGVVNEGV